MIAVDTNVLVRLLVRDDEVQFKSALAILRDEEVFFRTRCFWKPIGYCDSPMNIHLKRYVQVFAGPWA